MSKISSKDFDVNKKYGRLTPIVELPKKNSKIFWLFKCDCGKEKSIYIYTVMSGRSTSCGCYAREVSRGTENKFKLPFGEGGKRQLFLAYKRGAVDRNLEFSISLEEFSILTSGNCHYCGIPPSNTTIRNCGGKLKGNGEYTYNGIDRVNSNIGYEITNLVSCCKTCNYAKNNLSYEDFMTWINRLISFRTKGISHE